METRANYVAIGAFVVMVMLAALGSLMWLYRSSEPGQQAFIRVVFPEPVTGLSIGGSVLYNGIRVGEVTRLEWQPRGGDDVIAVARVTQNAPVKPDTEAKLSSTGLTGVSFISLTGGDPEAESIFAGLGEGEIPTLRAATSDFTSVLDSAQTVLAQINETLGEVNGILRDNRENVGAVLTNARTLSESLAASAPASEGLIGDAGAAAQEIAEAVPVLSRTVDRADTLLAAVPPAAVTQIVGDVSTFANSLPSIADQAQTIVGNVGGVVNRLDDAAGTLGEALEGALSVVSAVSPGVVGQFVTDAGTAANNLAELSGSLAEVREDAAEAVRNANTLTAELSSAASRAPELVDNLNARISDAGDVIRALDADAINRLINSADQAAAGLAMEIGRIGPAITAATTAAQNIAVISRTVRERSTAIGTTLDDVAATAASARSAADRLPGLVDAMEPGISNLSAVLSAVDPVAVEDLVNNAAAFAATLAENRQAITDIAQRVAGAAERIDAIASAFQLELPEIRQFIGDARTFAGNLTGLVDQLEPGLQNVSQALASIVPDEVGQAVSNVESFTSALSDRTAAIGQLIDDAGTFASGLADQAPSISDLVGSARDVATRLNGLTEEVSPQVGAIVESAREAVRAAQEFADQLPGFGRTLQPGIENMSAVLTDIDRNAVQAIVADAAVVANSLAGQMEPVADAIAAARDTADAARTLSTAIAERTPQITTIINDAQIGVDAAARVALEVESTVASVRPNIESVAAAVAVLTPERVTRLANDVQLIVDGLIIQSDRFNSIMLDIQAATANARSVTTTIAERNPAIAAAIDRTAQTITNLDAASINARQFAARLPEIAEIIEPGVANVSAVLQAVDPQAVRAIVDDLGALSAALAAEAPSISQIVGDLSATASDVRATAATIRSELGTFTSLLNSAEAATADARLFAAGLTPLLAEIRPGVNNLSVALESIDPQAVQSIVEDLRNTLNTVADNRESIASIIGSVERATANVERVSATIGARSATIGAAIDNARTVTQTLADASPQVTNVLNAVEATAEQLRETISAVDPAQVRAIVADVRAVTRAVGERAGEIGEAIDDATNAARGLAQALGNIDGQQGEFADVIDRARQLIQNLEGASKNVSIVAARAADLFSGPVQSFVAEADNAATQVSDVAEAFASRADAIAGGLARFSTGGLDDLRGVLTQGRTTLAAIENTVNSIERNPSRVIFGGPDGPRYSPQRR